MFLLLASPSSRYPRNAKAASSSFFARSNDSAMTCCCARSVCLSVAFCAVGSHAIIGLVYAQFSGRITSCVRSMSLVESAALCPASSVWICSPMCAIALGPVPPSELYESITEAGSSTRRT